MEWWRQLIEVGILAELKSSAMLQDRVAKLDAKLAEVSAKMAKKPLTEKQAETASTQINNAQINIQKKWVAVNEEAVKAMAAIDKALAADLEFDHRIEGFENRLAWSRERRQRDADITSQARRHMEAIMGEAYREELPVPAALRLTHLRELIGDAIVIPQPDVDETSERDGGFE